jgi:hypothetical protein
VESVRLIKDLLDVGKGGKSFDQRSSGWLPGYASALKLHAYAS